jgi:hypothetical protein
VYWRKASVSLLTAGFCHATIFSLAILSVATHAQSCQFCISAKRLSMLVNSSFVVRATEVFASSTIACNLNISDSAWGISRNCYNSCIQTPEKGSMNSRPGGYSSKTRSPTGTRNCKLAAIFAVPSGLTLDKSGYLILFLHPLER